MTDSAARPSGRTAPTSDRVYLFYGAGAWSGAARFQRLADAPGFVMASGAGAKFGRLQASPRIDLDGDRVDDLLIGAPNADVDTAGMTTGAGRVYVAFGGKAGPGLPATTITPIENRSIAGSGGFLVESPDGQPLNIDGSLPAFTDVTKAIGENWYRIATLGDGQIGDQIRLRVLRDDGSTTASRPATSTTTQFPLGNQFATFKAGSTLGTYSLVSTSQLKVGTLLANSSGMQTGSVSFNFGLLLAAVDDPASITAADLTLRLGRSQSGVAVYGTLKAEILDEEPDDAIGVNDVARSALRLAPITVSRLAAQGDPTGFGGVSNTTPVTLNLTSVVQQLLAIGHTRIALRLSFQPENPAALNQELLMSGGDPANFLSATTALRPGVLADVIDAQGTYFARGATIVDLRDAPANDYYVRVYDPFVVAPPSGYTSRGPLEYQLEIEAPKLGDADQPTDRDLLRGGDGNDLLRGHADRDCLYGDNGTDTFQGEAVEFLDTLGETTIGVADAEKLSAKRKTDDVVVNLPTAIDAEISAALAVRVPDLMVTGADGVARRTRDLYTSDLTQLVEFYPSENVTNLAGLEYATNLEYLSLRHSKQLTIVNGLAPLEVGIRGAGLEPRGQLGTGRLRYLNLDFSQPANFINLGGTLSPPLDVSSLHELEFFSFDYPGTGTPYNLAKFAVTAGDVAGPRNLRVLSLNGVSIAVVADPLQNFAGLQELRSVSLVNTGVTGVGVLAGVTVIDSDEPGVISGAGWVGDDNGAAYGSDYRLLPAGSAGGKATYTFTNVAADASHELFVTWTAGESHSELPSYAVYDGATLIGPAGSTAAAAIKGPAFDQRFEPTGAKFPSNGNRWQSLGQFTSNTGTLKVELTNEGKGHLVADAVRLKRVGAYEHLVNLELSGNAKLGNAFFEYQEKALTGRGVVVLRDTETKAPVLAPIGPQSMWAGQQLSVRLGATDPETPATVLYDTGNTIVRYDPQTKTSATVITSANLSGANRMIYGPDGRLYVANGTTIYRYNPVTGSGGVLISGFAAATSPVPDMAFGPDGLLYVLEAGTYQVKRYDPNTLTPLPAPGEMGATYLRLPELSVGLNWPRGLAFSPEGHLFISTITNQVLRYDGQTRAPLPAEGQAGAIFLPEHGVEAPRRYGMAFGPDGALYVASNTSGDNAGPNAIKRYDRATGAALPNSANDPTNNYVILPPSSPAAQNFPYWIEFDHVSGQLYIGTVGGLHRYSPATGLETVVTVGSDTTPLSPIVVPQVTYKAESDSPGVTPTIVGDRLVMKAMPGFVGSARVTVTAEDLVAGTYPAVQAGRSASRTFDVFVTNASPAPVASVGFAPTSDRQLNVTNTSGNQDTPKVAVDTDGDFVIVWEDDQTADVFLRRYSSAGGALDAQDIRVNVFTTGTQADAAVAMQANGDFVVVWRSTGQGTGVDVIGRRFKADGTPILRNPSATKGDPNQTLDYEFRINSVTTGNQWYPSVAVDPDGDFVVTWWDNRPSFNGYDIYAQRFNNLGAPAGGNFLVNVYTANDQTYPEVAMDAAGNFTIAWNSYGQDGSDYGVYARRYLADGTKVARHVDAIPGTTASEPYEFRVNTYTTLRQMFPSVAIDSSGNFVIAWESSDQDELGAFAQRFNKDGAPLERPAGFPSQLAGEGKYEFRVNTEIEGEQRSPSVGVDDSGNFAIAWSGNAGSGGPDSGGIRARRFASNGLPIGAESQVNSFLTGDQVGPYVATDADGDFVIAWQSAGQDGNGLGNFFRQGRIFETPFTAVSPGVITGRVTVASAGLESATVFLDLNGDGVASSGEPATTTDAAGAFWFGSLTPGAYKVTAVPPTAFAAAANPQTVTVTAGKVVTGVDFALTRIIDLGSDRRNVGPEGSPVNVKALLAAGATGLKWSVNGVEQAGQVTDTLAFTPPDDGDHTITLTAKLGAAAYIDNVILGADNVAPVAAITGPSGSVTEGTVLGFEAAVNDPAGVNDSMSSYHWTVLRDGSPEAVYDDLGKGSAWLNFLPTALGDYTVTLIVRDDADAVSNTATRTFALTKASPGVEVTVVGPAVVEEGQSFTFEGVLTYPATLDVPDLRWTVASSNKQVAIADGSGTSFGFVAPDSGTYTVTFTATDADGDVASKSVVVTANNVAPAFELGDDVVIVQGQALPLTVNATDLAGSFDPFDYLWEILDASEQPTGVKETSKDFVFTPNSDGHYYVRLTVTDDDMAAATDKLKVTVKAASPYGVVVSGTTAVVEGGTVSLSGDHTVSPVPDTYSYSWIVIDPSGAVEVTGVGKTLNFKPGDNGTYLATFTVQNGAGVPESKSLPVVVANIAPTITSPGGPVAILEGDVFAGMIEFTDPGFDTVDAASVDFGNGVVQPAQFDQANKRFTFAHTYTDSGVYQVKVKFFDEDGEYTATHWTVTSANLAPTAAGLAGPAQAAANQEVTYVLAGPTDASAADLAAGLKYSFDWADDGNFDVTDVSSPSASHAFAAPGNYSVRARVKDKDGAFTDHVTSITITPANAAPALGLIADQVANEKQPFQLTVVGTDPDVGQKLTYHLDVAPNGMFIDTASGSIKWTPTEAQGPDTYDVTVRVSDNGSPSLSATRSFKITVNEVSAPPTVTAVKVNGGDIQRSRVTSIAVTFSEGVSFPNGVSAAFQLARIGPGAATGSVNLAAVQSGADVFITFLSGGAVGIDLGGSLLDGIYQLTVVAANVQGTSGILDGNNDGTAGGDYLTPPGPAGTPGRIHRLFGDNDGDGDVDTLDFGAFRGSFGGVNSIFDLDGDGDVDTSDFGAFRSRFGAIV